MQLTFASILTAAAFIGAASACPGHHGYHGNHGNHGHKAQHAPKGKAFDHILQIWFENEDFSTVAATPAFQTFLKKGILLDNFNALTHPSEPNYVAAAGGQYFGINQDYYYNIPANVSTVYDLLEKKGLTWKVYEESIPNPGYTGYQAGEYVRKNNPAIIFDSVGLNATRAQNVVGADQFQKDVTSSNLPNWMFFVPNLLNDGHDTNTTFAGNWFTQFYENTLVKSGILDKTLVLLTFDEALTNNARNQVWSLLIGAIPKHLEGTVDSTFYTHYSALNTVEQNWDLGNLGQQDANKTVSNVFEFAAKALNYKNVDIPASQAPWMNTHMPGLLTGKSYNETHPAVSQTQPTA